jgi:hypothetical protein
MERTEDGLPPVGTEANSKNGVVLIKAYFGSQVWYQSQHGEDIVRLIESAEFRPLKSKRDEYCCEVYDILKNSQSIPECCERLYDAGYRKQMPYSQFVSILQVYLGEEFKWSDSFALMKAMDLAEKLGRTTEEN